MKALLQALVALSLFACAASPARAQVHRGDLRLFFDTGLLSYTMDRVKAEAPGTDFKRSDNQLSIGPGPGAPVAGVGFAYAASRHVLPGLYLGFSHAKLTGETEIDGNRGRVTTSEPEVTFTQLELRPNVELTVNPEGSFVPYLMLGLSFVRQSASVDDDDEDVTAFGVGPAAGLGFHAFPTSRVSFDLGFTFRALFIDDDDTEDRIERAGFDDVRQREYAFILTLGASYWL